MYLKFFYVGTIISRESLRSKAYRDAVDAVDAVGSWWNFHLNLGVAAAGPDKGLSTQSFMLVPLLREIKTVQTVMSAASIATKTRHDSSFL